MAGIAFRLQKLLSGKSYGDLIRAYLYSAVISTGPFLVVIFALLAVKSMVQIRLSIEEGDLLLSLIVYAFAFSMLGVAPFIYVVTRFLADRYYLKQIDAFSPSYITVLFTVFSIQSLVAIPYLSYLDVSLNAKWVLFCLYLFINGYWIAMVYLSAARNYMWIVAAFLLGGIVSVVLAYFLGMKYGFSGILNGFTAGQGFCFFLLSLRIFKEFGYKTSYDFGFIGYFGKHPYLIVIGVLYYLGIWIDKFIFWFSPYGEQIAPGVRIYSHYDISMFLAYLTVVPSMAFFLVQMETSFAKKYHAYYDCIRKRANLNIISEKRKEIIENLSNHFQKYALFQGIITGIVIIFLYDLAEAFGLNPYQMGILRIAILGAFLQMGFLMILNIIFYFDFQKEALIMTLLFLVTNAIFTLISLHIGFIAFGFGYAAACFVTVIVSFMILNYKLKRLEFLTFMKQPILIPQFKFESELETTKQPELSGI